MGSATKGGLIGGKLGDTLGEGASMLAGGLTVLVSVGLTLAHPERISTPSKLIRNSVSLIACHLKALDPKGHDLNCIMM
jgi:hypothetical protein